jgi:hypothetical protein
MFRQTLITIAFNAIRLYMGTGPFERIGALVESLLDDPRTGAEKRDFVITNTTAEFTTISRAIVRAAIEIILIAKAPEVVGVIKAKSTEEV